jgi:N-acetylmuramoyl-L-alanine amidase
MRALVLNVIAARTAVAIGLLALCLGADIASAEGRFTTVVIDAGHGGYDRGGIPGQRVAESTVCLDVAQRLQRNLERAGYRTVMTRSSDVFVPLAERVAIANRYRNAIFVAVHFNSAGRSGANGIETYFYSGESSPLAASIHRNVLAAAGTENRGVRRRGYFVLRKTRIPAVLVECGFLTNPGEANLALTSAHRQKLADQIARGIQSQPVVASRTGSSSSVAASGSYGRSGMYRVDSNGTKYLDMTQVSEKRSRKSRKSASSHSSHSKKKKKSSTSTRKKTKGKEES